MLSHLLSHQFFILQNFRKRTKFGCRSSIFKETAKFQSVAALPITPDTNDDTSIPATVPATMKLRPTQRDTEVSGCVEELMS